MAYWPPADLGELLQLVETAFLATGLALAGRSYSVWREAAIVQSIRQGQFVTVKVGGPYRKGELEDEES